MVIKLLPQQIPAFWEAIKFATVSADEIDEKIREVYLIDLLHSLLNSKAQCFIKLDSERKLQALLITKFQIDKFTGVKSLFIMPFFSWSRATFEEWKSDFLTIKQFAEKEGCKYVTFNSRNQRVWELGEVLGFVESIRTFYLDLGGV